MAISCIASHQYLLMPSLSPNCCPIQAQRFSKETNQGSWGGGAYQEKATWDSVADALTVFPWSFELEHCRAVASTCLPSCQLAGTISLGLRCFRPSLLRGCCTVLISYNTDFPDRFLLNFGCNSSSRFALLLLCCCQDVLDCFCIHFVWSAWPGLISN